VKLEFKNGIIFKITVVILIIFECLAIGLLVFENFYCNGHIGRPFLSIFNFGKRNLKNIYLKKSHFISTHGDMYDGYHGVERPELLYRNFKVRVAIWFDLLK